MFPDSLHGANKITHAIVKPHAVSLFIILVNQIVLLPIVCRMLSYCTNKPKKGHEHNNKLHIVHLKGDNKWIVQISSGMYSIISYKHLQVIIL